VTRQLKTLGNISQGKRGDKKLEKKKISGDSQPSLLSEGRKQCSMEDVGRKIRGSNLGAANIPKMAPE